MGKTLEQRLAEVDKRYGLDTEPEDDEVKERKRKEKEEAEEVYEAVLRESGVVARYDPTTGNAYITLDEAELSLDERLDEVDRRHGLQAQRLG